MTMETFRVFILKILGRGVFGPPNLCFSDNTGHLMLGTKDSRSPLCLKYKLTAGTYTVYIAFGVVQKEDEESSGHA